MWFRGQPETFTMFTHRIRRSPSTALYSLGIILHSPDMLTWVSFPNSPSQEGSTISTWVLAVFTVLPHWTTDACSWIKNKNTTKRPCPLFQVSVLLHSLPICTFSSVSSGSCICILPRVKSYQWESWSTGELIYWSITGARGPALWF